MAETVDQSSDELLVLRDENQRLKLQLQTMTHDLLTIIGAEHGNGSEAHHLEISSSLINQHLRDQIALLQQQQKILHLFGELSDFLQLCLSIDEAFTVAINLMEPLFPQCSGIFYHINPSRHWVEPIAWWGDWPAALKTFPIADCWALRYGGTHVVQTNQAHLRCRHSAEEAPEETLCIPLMAQGEISGLLYLASSHFGYLGLPQQQLAHSIAKQMSLTIANLRLRESLHNQSIRDHLTGLYNRRYLEHALENELQRAQRYSASVGVIMIDIDHFKRLNDTFGHNAGDQMLQELGWLISHQIRSSDIACRYGGEELIVILPESSLADTEAKAELLRAAIANLQIIHSDTIILSVTASFGVAVFPEHGQNSDQLLRSADLALYNAKSSNRNRVMIAAPLATETL